MEAKLGALCKRGHDDDGYGHSLRDRHGGCIACRKTRYENNKTEVLQYNREYWKNLDPEKKREYAVRYRHKHPEVRRRAHRRYYQRYRERILAQRKEYRETRREYLRQYFRDYRKKNADKIRAYIKSRRSK